MAIYKILANSSIPAAGVALCMHKGTLDSDTYPALTEELIKKAIKDGLLAKESKGERRTTDSEEA